MMNLYPLIGRAESGTIEHNTVWRLDFVTFSTNDRNSFHYRKPGIKGRDKDNMWSDPMSLT